MWKFNIEHSHHFGLKLWIKDDQKSRFWRRVPWLSGKCGWSCDHNKKRQKPALIMSDGFKKKVSSVASLLKPVSQWQVSFPGGSEVKNPPASEGNVGLIPGSGRSPGGGNGCKFPFLPGKSHGQRCPMGYRLQKRKESDTMEALSTTTNWWQATLLQVRLLAA